MNGASTIDGRLLGCVLAGGESKRFGTDKAMALLDGRTLLDRAVATLAAVCDAVVVAGRAQAPVRCVADWPQAGQGPLGGLAGALRDARTGEFAAVLTIGVDSIGLPDDFPAVLSPGPACLAAQPVVGLWPVSTLAVLEAILTGGERRSMLHFAERAGARLVEIANPPANINTPEDLARIVRDRG
ncbi:molybdenum cofactor guanylyltransferase [Croceicoccus bisphenolivorans]|uniref:molybdenum cofactor guanylyltransferase n=1 Tax=Croceicoccus bisphenolivorans TaxID=1783232 RepID=UPI000A7673BF|nr:molybdenum cofactor guanylyltransferase [Croceicoccus bisphenolivorans]